MLQFGTRVKVSENSRHETETFPTAIIVSEGVAVENHKTVQRLPAYRYFAIFEGVGYKNILAKLYTEEIVEVLEVLPVQEAAKIYREVR